MTIIRNEQQKFCDFCKGFIDTEKCSIAHCPHKRVPAISEVRDKMEAAPARAISISPRQRLLEEAIKITTQDRNSAYGNPEDNFQNIAAYWNLYLRQAGVMSKDAGRVLRPQDVAHMMILMKQARLATNPNHRDSLLDIAGYAACGEDCRSKDNEP